MPTILKRLLMLGALVALLGPVQRLAASDIITPEEASRRVSTGEAILIDVREPEEWTGGVVAGALLLPLSDLRGDRKLWKPVLGANRNKELIIYCRSGNRSAQAITILEKEKFEASNAGGFAAWKSAGQAVTNPAATP